MQNIIKLWAQLTKKGIRWASLILSPPFCSYCKMPLKQRIPLCHSCTKKIEPLISHPIQLTQKYTLTVFSVGAYKEPLKHIILAKARSDILACYHMAQLLMDHVIKGDLACDYIVPVPLHWTRYAKRGYNQSAELAKHLSRMTGVPVLDALKRCKRTPFQSRCSQEQRLANVKDAFILVPEAKEALKGKRLLLVDDVMTTGATLKAAARQLLPVRPTAVSALVLARTS